MFFVRLSALKDVQQGICATQFPVQLLLFLSPDKQDNFQFQFNLFQLHAQSYQLHQFHVRHQMFFVQILTLKDVQQGICAMQFHVHLLLFLSPDKLEFGIQNFIIFTNFVCCVF